MGVSEKSPRWEQKRVRRGWRRRSMVKPNQRSRQLSVEGRVWNQIGGVRLNYGETMLSILHNQGDSPSSFRFTRKSRGDQDRGLRGRCRCITVQEKESCITCKTPAGLQPPAGVPLNFSAVPPAHRLVIIWFLTQYLKPKLILKESQSTIKRFWK